MGSAFGCSGGHSGKGELHAAHTWPVGAWRPLRCGTRTRSAVRNSLRAARSAQTAAPSQFTLRTTGAPARALCASPSTRLPRAAPPCRCGGTTGGALANAPCEPPPGRPQAAERGSYGVNSRDTGCPCCGPCPGAEAHSGRGGAPQDALRKLTRRICLSGTRAARGASYATHPGCEHRREVEAKRRPPGLAGSRGAPWHGLPRSQNTRSGTTKGCRMARLATRQNCPV